MKAIIADITTLYGAIDTSDQYHSRAQAELRRIESEDLTVIISFPVYIETYSLLLYRLGFEQATHRKFGSETPSFYDGFTVKY
ncbi:hypothetical protein MICAF_80001 [Microcystis aeruginosa PCC 9807]|uniref:PIN domain-containing protein n=1 Tax=Microcystis aeruginosa PCC 9807 TaxID=1160283 RepID=I4HET1_MICAE|nr:hypothetical protein MICAF_80001 [Microcystis aeruginosa PCC 9807]